MECRSCRRCMFYVARPNGLVGRCRRHAPTMQGWPVMHPDSWCGDYKLDETVSRKEVIQEKETMGGYIKDRKGV